MTIDFLPFARAHAVLTALPLLALLVAATARAQDQPPAEASKNDPARAQAADDVAAARARLAESIDKSVADQLVVDLVGNLVSANALGIDLAAPEPALRAQLGLAEREGAVVTNVPDESLGAKAGLKPHDVVVELDGQKVEEPDALSRLLDEASGKQITLKLWRGGKLIEITAAPKKPETASVKLAAEAAFQLADLEVAHARRYRLGVTLSEADETLRTQLRLAAGEGLVVTEVLPQSAAAQAGILPHDVLTMLDGKRLTTVEAINAQIQEIKDRSVELRLLRGGKETTIQVAARNAPGAALIDRALNVVWSTESCKTCHQDPHPQDPHVLMGWKLGARQSVWTDGQHTRVHVYEQAFRAQTEAGQKAAQQEGPQAQIGALKSQLDQMHKTLSALEAALQQKTQPPADDPQGKQD
jgi:membrane-associated protease RseP (regulator of RpoE activity)